MARDLNILKYLLLYAIVFICSCFSNSELLEYFINLKYVISCKFAFSLNSYIVFVQCYSTLLIHVLHLHFQISIKYCTCILLCIFCKALFLHLYFIEFSFNILMWITITTHTLLILFMDYFLHKLDLKRYVTLSVDCPKDIIGRYTISSVKF